MSGTSQQGEWVTVDLKGCRARCHVVPRNGHTAVIEIRVLPKDGDEISITALYDLRRSDIIEAHRPSERELGEMRPELHGRRSSDREGLLAMVAIAYEEALCASTPDLDVHVWEFLTELHRIESDDDWPWEETVIGRPYARSSVRTLISDARKRGYLKDPTKPCNCAPNQCVCAPSEYSACATIDHATQRKTMYSHTS